jgi:hypothetical protein
MKTTFVNFFLLNESTNQVSFSPDLFLRLRLFKQALQDKRLSYQAAGISPEYFQAFCQNAIAETLSYVEELKAIRDQYLSISPQQPESLDYNFLDYLEGTIKSACDNEIATWPQLGLTGKNEFDELIMEIKDFIINRANQLYFSTNNETATANALEDALPYFEFNNNDDDYAGNLWDEEDYNRDHNCLCKLQQQTVSPRLIDSEDALAILQLAKYNELNIYLTSPAIKDYNQFNPLEAASREQLQLEDELEDCENRNHFKNLTGKSASLIANCHQ